VIEENDLTQTNLKNCIQTKSMDSPAPLRFFYTHLHDAIKKELKELELLSNSARALDFNNVCENQEISLVQLRKRYHFLEQVYKYHSSVEDEVSRIPETLTWLQEPQLLSPTSPTSHTSPHPPSSPGHVPSPRGQGQKRHNPILHRTRRRRTPSG
jgi:hypothetical protein